MQRLKDLFSLNIEEEVPLVIKAGEQDPKIAQKEISEYIVTHQIENHLETFFNHFNQNSTNKIGVWISGFFGSGKSYFAKILGYLLMNKTLPSGNTMREKFKERLANSKNREFISGQIDALNKFPTHTVMFEIIAESSGYRDTVQQVMFRSFLKSLGYSDYPTVATMEFELDEHGLLKDFKDYVISKGEDWEKIRKNSGSFKNEAVNFLVSERNFMQETAKEFLKSAIDKYKNLAPADFARICLEYSQRINKRIAFIIDEMGQYVTSEKTDEKLLQLQAIAEEFASKGTRRLWLIVTSQEKLNALAENLDSRKLSKLVDRFEVRLDLTSENVDEVAREKLLKKKKEFYQLFEETYSKKAGSIQTMSYTGGKYKRTSDAESFRDYYPFFQYQFEILPEIVQNASGMMYSQATERKFIFIVDKILKDLRDEEFGRVVNATDLFDALGTSFFGSGVVAHVKKVDEYYEGKRIKASDILKALELIKRLRHISATEEVIAHMLCKHLDDKPHEIQKDVKELVKHLEKDKYVTVYNGEISLITDLEREFLDEYDRQANTKPEKNGEITSHLKDIFDLKEVRYKSGPTIPIKWIYGDNIESWGKSDGITIKLFPFDEKINEEEIEFESYSKNDQIYIIPSGENNVYDLADEVLKYEKTLNSFRGKRSSPDSRDVLEKYGRILEEKRRELKKEIKTAYDNGKIIYYAEKVQKGRDLSDTITTIIFEKVVPEVYPRITETSAKMTEVIDVLKSPPDKLHLIRDDDDHAVFTEEGELVETHKLIAPFIEELKASVKKGSDLLDTFSRKPYGWTQETILYALAAMLKTGKIEINGMDVSNDIVINIFKSQSKLREATIRLVKAMPVEMKEALINLLNPIVSKQEQLHLRDPNSRFKTVARNVMNELYDRANRVQMIFSDLVEEEKGFFDIELLRELKNILTGLSDEALERVIENKEKLEDMIENLKKAEEYLKTNERSIRKEKDFIQQLNNEMSKVSRDGEIPNELKATIEQFYESLPLITKFDTSLHEHFEKARNMYIAIFKKIHDARNEKRRELFEYLQSIKDKENPLGERVSDTEWYKNALKRLPSDCSELRIEYSIKCENCHAGYHECELELERLERLSENVRADFEKFMKKQPISSEPSIKKLRVKKRITYKELKEKVNSLDVDDHAVVEIETED
ncbi:MAG TPA: BREX system P-loop protein BrxC [Thermotogae bacterium]|nr:BREX system P-loop protein BrxC [Thermotogota bacterium]